MAIIITIILISLFCGGGDKKGNEPVKFVTRSGRVNPPAMTAQDSLIIQIQQNLKIIEDHIDKN